MQKIATKVFITASVMFGIVGIILVFSTPAGGDNVEPNVTLLKILQTTGLVVLTSFALSVAGKYLNGKS